MGKPKSTVIFSSLQVTSTMISRSTQNSSTCSRDQGSEGAALLERAGAHRRST